MKILILSDANSVHTLKWVKALKKHELNLMLFSLFKPNKDYENIYNQLNVVVESPNLRSKINNLRNPNFTKINYISGLKLLKKTITNFQPDILHAHYASSYGVIALLSRYKPFILSVWGSDIYDFPNRNLLNKFLIKKVIKTADVVCSTSEAMSEIINKNFSKSTIHIIPFGVDIDLFLPTSTNPKVFTVGTIKSIEDHNGIDCLLDAASILVNKYNEKRIQYLIVGKGSLLEEMKQKATKLKLDDFVTFSGEINYNKIVEYHQMLSIFIAMSTRESFGVAILEAAACGIPSITSDIGGLPEVNQNGVTGLIIKPNDSKKLAESIIKLFEDYDYRNRLGKQARYRVEKYFNWNNNVKKMINIYNGFVN